MDSFGHREALRRNVQPGMYGHPVGCYGSNPRTFNPYSIKEIRMEKVSRRTAMKVAAAGTVAVGTAVLSGTAAGDEPKPPKLWTLEGELRVHPKFLYRYYLVLLGTGQICALYGAEDQLARLKLPIGVNVRGVLGTKYQDGGTKAN